MYKLEYTGYFEYPREIVFKVFRDKLLEYTKYAPNLRKVEILEKKQISKDKLKTKTKWVAGAQIPLIVRAVLLPHMLSWYDETIWDSKEYRWEWVITPYYFKEYVECKGSWSLEEYKLDETKIVLDGYFKVYIPHFPGVPDRIAQKAGPIIEKMIGRYFKPNLAEVIKAVRKFLEKERY